MGGRLRLHAPSLLCFPVFLIISSVARTPPKEPIRPPCVLDDGLARQKDVRGRTLTYHSPTVTYESKFNRLNFDLRTARYRLADVTPSE